MDYIMPESVTIDNFLSVEHAEFSYKNRGLVLVDGPTGSGKSSLFVEPLCWGLFGQPMRDIGPDEVVNRFVGKNCHVGVTLTTARYNRDTGIFEPDPDGVKAIVHSYRKNVTFEIWQNGKKLDDRTGNRMEQTRDNIVKYLDMDYTAFTNSVVFSQSIAKYFSGLTDKSQKEIVERLLGIGWIPDVYEVAKADVASTNAELQTGLRDFDTTNEALKEARNTHKTTKLNHDNFEAEKQAKIDKLSQELTKLEIKDLSEYERLVAEGEAALAEINARIVGATAKKELSEINLKIGAARERREGALREVGKFQAKAKSLESLSADTECDKCGQAIKEAAKKRYAKKLADETVIAQGEYDRLDAEWKTLLEQAREIGKRARAEDGQETERLLLEKELKTVKKSYEDERLENAKVEEKKNSIFAQVELVRNEQNVYKSLIDTLEKKISDLEKVKERLEAASTRLADELEYHKFWEVGYSNKGLKSLLMDSVTPRMNRSAYTYSKIFGDVFSIGFNTQSSTKKGDIREKFAVEIDNRAGSSTYYGNSEGEKRTIDTIVMFALGDLAAERSSKRFSILVLDDVFEKLDEELCTSVINVLAAMTTPNSVLMPDEDGADDYIRMLARLPKRDSIFVLTHLEYFKSKFENKVRVGKTDGKTRFW